MCVPCTNNYYIFGFVIFAFADEPSVERVKLKLTHVTDITTSCV
jgi:hypothetical protein